jgi:transposase
MYLRRCPRRKNSNTHEYWQLVESYRTACGPRQRVVSYLGDMDEAGRLGVTAAAESALEADASSLASQHQPRLIEEVTPRWVEVDTGRVRVERIREFGGPWLGHQVLKKLGLPELLEELLPQGREQVPWAVMAQVLVLARLCDPASELQIAEQFFERSGLSDLLGVPVDRVNDDRLYRALDQLLPYKAQIETHLKTRLGELFGFSYDILLYDITSTYFEGECARNEQAQRGYSRDHRGDCKQVCIALVESREGMPLGYEVFAGNRSDVTTVEEIVTLIETRYGQSDRIWVMDRGMVSEDNLEFLQDGRRYILGTPRGELKRYEQQLQDKAWTEVRDGLEVKLCPGPNGREVFILCRSTARREKEAGIHARFEKRLEAGLQRMAQSCDKRRQQVGVIERRVGRLLGQNSRAAGLFNVTVTQRADGGAVLNWEKDEKWREWAELSEGCYLLRSNVADWSGEELWKAYIQLTEAEKAFRIHKQDLSMRPIWHQREDRVQAHILVCFLAYVVRRALGQMCRAGGLGDESRKVWSELSTVRLVDVVLPTRSGVPIRRRCVSQPEKHQAILLQRLGLTLPTQLEMYEL